MSKHTPGPWVIFRDNEKSPRVAYIRTPGSKFCANEIAVLYGDDNEANARLIAACPGLIKALVMIEAEVRAYGELYTPGGACDKKWKRALKAAQDAIAKARGDK